MSGEHEEKTPDWHEELRNWAAGEHPPDSLEDRVAVAVAGLFVEYDIMKGALERERRTLAKLTAERDAVKDNAALAKDAERYRWLRVHGGDAWYGDELLDLVGEGHERLDDAVDAKMARRVYD